MNNLYFMHKKSFFEKNMLKLLIFIHDTRIFINNEFQMRWRTRLCQKKKLF